MERLGAFQSAFAVRQVEMGLAIMLSIVLGDRDAFWSSLARRTCVSAMDGRSAYRGRRFDAGFGDRDGLQRLFGSRNGDPNMPARAVLVAWVIALGVLMWRRDGSGDPAA